MTSELGTNVIIVGRFMAKPSPDPTNGGNEGKRAKTKVPKRVKTAPITISTTLAAPKI